MSNDALPYDTCPHCGTSQLGDPIPTMPGKRFRHTIGVQIPGVYDGVLFHECPACGGRWHRWPKGHDLRPVAEPYVQKLRSHR